MKLDSYLAQSKREDTKHKPRLHKCNYQYANGRSYKHCRQNAVLECVQCKARFSSTTACSKRHADLLDKKGKASCWDGEKHCGFHKWEPIKEST